MFTNDEKEYLKILLKRELDHFKREEPTVAAESALKFLKAEHEYGHFLEALLKKIEK